MINLIREALKILISILKNERIMRIAKETWNIIDEEFRIKDKIEDTFQSKAAEFDKLMKERIPELEDKEIVLLRQSIAGEINKNKESVLKESDYKSKCEELTKENNLLKEQLDRVQALLTPADSKQ